MQIEEWVCHYWRYFVEKERLQDTLGLDLKAIAPATTSDERLRVVEAVLRRTEAEIDRRLRERDPLVFDRGGLIAFRADVVELRAMIGDQLNEMRMDGSEKPDDAWVRRAVAVMRRREQAAPAAAVRTAAENVAHRTEETA